MCPGLQGSETMLEWESMDDQAVGPWLPSKGLSLPELALRLENHFQMSPALGRGGGVSKGRGWLSYAR